MYSGTYLNAEAARRDKIVNKWMEIEDVYKETFNETKQGKTIQVDKLVLKFSNIDYELPLNKTNGRTMIKDFGGETDNWVGKKIKFRIHQYETGEGIVIKSKQELEDEGETPPSSDSNEPDLLNMTETDVNNIPDEAMKKTKDWFDKVEENLPQSKEDLKDKEKVACEWINRIRSDLLNEGVKKVTPKMIRDNVAVLVSEENMKEDDLGDLNEDAGRDIFKVLRNIDPV